MFTPRRRHNPFEARNRKRKAAEAATRKPAQTPSDPGGVPGSAPYVHENEVAAVDNLTETPDVATIPASNDVDLPTVVDTESDVKLFEPLPEDEQPLGDLREVVEMAERGARVDFKTAELEDDTATDEPPQVKRGRGRPRPQETIDRDNAVLSVLQTNPEGVSKSELAELLDEKEQQVYSSLRSLSKDGKARTAYVKDVGGYRWFAA